VSPPRIIVIGAGPAGVRAAQVLVEAGLRPVLIDENPASGGQIYRRQPEGFQRSHDVLYGAQASKAAALHRDFDALRACIDYRPQTLAWNLSPGALHVVQGQAASTLEFDALLICTGATDRLMPVSGWQQAGCYSLGATQIALKAQACAIGSKVAFLGTGPLLYLVARQYLAAGANVAAVLDTSARLPPLSALRGLLARPPLLWQGFMMIHHLRRARIPLRTRVHPLQIEGAPGQGVSSVVVTSPRGEERFECDALAMGWHLRAETQLADLAGCRFAFDSSSRQWLPEVDEDGRSSVAGVYLAGDGVRLLGADGAEVAGKLAALTTLADLDCSGAKTQHAAKAPALRRQLRTHARFRAGLMQAFAWPHAHTAVLDDEAVVCRCELIRAGELRHSVSVQGAHEINRAKAFSRVGMGRCQGRYCGHAAAEIIAAASGAPIAEVGRIRTQAPVKPLQMDLIAT